MGQVWEQKRGPKVGVQAEERPRPSVVILMIALVGIVMSPQPCFVAPPELHIDADKMSYEYA